MFISTDWEIENTEKANENILKVYIIETTIEKTIKTINSLLSEREIVDEFDDEIPNEVNKDDFKKYDICIVSKSDYFKNDYKNIENEEFEKTIENENEEKNMNEFKYLIIYGGYYSISYNKLNMLVKGITKPTIFKTLPYTFNFYSENSFIIPSLKYHNKLIELAITKQIDINENIIGIDKNKFKKFFESELLSSVRTAFVLETNIKYCKYALDKIKQLYKAKNSIRMKFRDLKKSLYSRITNDKIIKSYIKLLDSFSNYCSKEDYIFFCMMKKPELYQNAINMKFFLNSLMEVDPNKIDNRTLYDLLVEYSLYS